MGEQQSSPATPPFCLVDIRNLRIDDTPPLVKYTSTSSYATGSLMNGRRAVLADLGESITEVPVQFFLVNILPPLRGGINIGNVVEKLQRRKIITRDGLCKSLPSRPALSPSFENATFKSLEEISKSICDAAQIRGTKKTIYFENNPNITPESKMRDSTSRPDGYFILHDRLNGVHWMDFALCAEYKKRNTPKNVDDNVEKVVWGMHHCMREDPRRRFTFGLTIEDTNTRLWFCSRAEIMVTQPFNFMTDHDTFTHFLSFAYAEMHELGWDPTMRLVKDSKRTVQYDGNGAPRYDITVRVSDTKHVVYRTVKVLSDIGANAMQGRGTRVWEARQIVNGEERGDSVALKDSWIDSDRDREGTVFQALRDSNTTKKFQKRLDRHFLTVLCQGDVYVHGEQDHTRDLMTQGVEIPSGCAKLQNSPLPGTSVKRQVHTKSRHGTGDHRTAEEHDDQDLMIPPTPKAHYRIVFKEVCEPLFEITSLALIFKVLSQTVLALGLMHSSGIGDLEYAKKYLNNESMDNKRKHDVRTGTANFIVVEVDNRGYNFTPGPSAWVPKNALDIDSLDRLMDDIAEDPDTELGNIDIEKTVKSAATVAFRYNPIHDLESVWWVAVFFVLNKRVVRVGWKQASNEGQLATQVRNAKTLFYYRSKRTEAMLSNAARQHLVSHYSEAETNLAEIDNYVANIDELHWSLVALFVNTTQGLSVEIGPFRVHSQRDVKHHRGAEENQSETDHSYASTQNMRNHQRVAVEIDRGFSHGSITYNTRASARSSTATSRQRSTIIEERQLSHPVKTVIRGSSVGTCSWRKIDKAEFATGTVDGPSTGPFGIKGKKNQADKIHDETGRTTDAIGVGVAGDKRVTRLMNRRK